MGMGGVFGGCGRRAWSVGLRVPNRRSRAKTKEESETAEAVSLAASACHPRQLKLGVNDNRG